MNTRLNSAQRYGWSSARRSVGVCLMFAVLMPGPSYAEVKTFEVSFIRSMDKSAPFAFETKFQNVASFDSPTVSGSLPIGNFSFFAPPERTPGGYIQIRFPNVKATFDVTCTIGNTNQNFKVTMHNTGGRTFEQTVQAKNVGNDAVIQFKTQPMDVRGEYLIAITSPEAKTAWPFTKCVLTGTTQS